MRFWIASHRFRAMISHIVGACNFRSSLVIRSRRKLAHSLRGKRTLQEHVLITRIASLSRRFSKESYALTCFLWQSQIVFHFPGCWLSVEVLTVDIAHGFNHAATA